MTKRDLISKVANETGINQDDTKAVVESVMNQVQISLEKKEPIYLRGFGTFTIKHRAEKVGRNISKNTPILIPAHDIPYFKPSKEFCNRVK